MKKLWIEDYTDNPSVYYQEDSPDYYDQTFSDKTDDANAWFNNALGKVNYILVINNIKRILLPSYPNNTDEEKVILATIIALPYSERVPDIFDDEQDERHAGRMLIEAAKARTELIEDMRQHVFNYTRKGLMTVTNMKLFGDDVIGYMVNYERNVSKDLYKWINEDPPFQKKGFDSKNYLEEPYKTQLKKELLTYLR